MSNRLSFNRGLGYQGTNAVQPPECHFEDRNPTIYDTQGVSLLDLWLNTVTQQVWVLVSLAGNSSSNGSLATWVEFGSGDLQTLTSNSGGAVGPDALFNINIVGDGITITGVGNPATHTITLSASGSGIVSTLTGNSGGAVSPSGGNINVIGDTTTINIVGNPGTHTLTASATGIVATSFHTDNGTATPAAGIIDFNAISQAGSSVSFSGATNIVSLNTTDAGGNVLIGLQAGNATLTGTANTGIGYSVLHAITSGINNTVLGDLAAQTLTTGSSNVLIGKSAATAITTGSNNLIIGDFAGSALVTGSESSNIYASNAGVNAESNTMRLGTSGSGAGQVSNTYIAGINGVNVGSVASVVSISGDHLGSTTITAGTGITVTPGANVITLATTGAVANSFHTDNGIATPALGIITFNAISQAGSSVSFSGSGSTVSLNTTDANSNTIMGLNAGNGAVTASNTVGLGHSALHALTSGNANTVIGSLSGAAITSGANNTVIGEGSTTALTTGSANIIVGQATGTALTGAESNNVLIGDTGLVGVSSLLSVTIPGSGAPILHNFGTNNISLGQGAGNRTMTGSGNTFVGAGAGHANTTANANTFIGQGCGALVTSGGSNTGVGDGTFAALTTGTQNVALGDQCLESLTTGGNNIIVSNGGARYMTIGTDNTGLGYGVFTNSGSLTGPVSGVGNIAIGSNAGNALTAAESYNIYIQNGGVSGESNVLRISAGTGTGVNQLNKTFIGGIRGITTVNNDAVAVLIDSAGQLGTVSSSARYKENINDVGPRSEDITKLRPVVFNYKNHSPEETTYGLIAEEVAEIFPELVVKDKEGNPETIKYHELPILLLNELIKVKQELELLKQKLN